MLPVIFGLEGLVICDHEASFFREADPLGFILFARNIDNPEQVRALTSDLRDIVGRDCPILVDQEGGRVQRLCAPHWPAYPAMMNVDDADLEETLPPLPKIWLMWALM